MIPALLRFMKSQDGMGTGAASQARPGEGLTRESAFPLCKSIIKADHTVSSVHEKAGAQCAVTSPARPSDGRAGERGFILLTSYMLISVMSISSFALFSRGNSFRQASERSINKTVAFNMAESALDVAIAAIEADDTYPGTNGYTAFSTNATQQGGYSVTVTTPEGNANVRQITATGSAPSNVSTATAYETRTVTAYVELQTNSMFDFAVFAEDSVTMSGNAEVDSYNSTNGAYGGSNVASNGDVGTDSIGLGTVSLSGNSVITGDVQVGPGGNPADVITTSGNAEIQGTTAAADSPRAYTAQTSNAASLGALSLSGNTTLDLGAGTYRYSSLSITGNARLRALGPITVYVDGIVKIAGNGVSTQGNNPPNFVLYQTTGADVQLSGNGAFYGGIFAPLSDVKNTGNGALFGAVVSENYKQSGNGAVHFDEAMKDVGSVSSDGVGVLSWVEENTTAWRH